MTGPWVSRIDLLNSPLLISKVSRVRLQVSECSCTVDIVLQELLVGLVRLQPFQSLVGEHLGYLVLAFTALHGVEPLVGLSLCIFKGGL